MRRYDLAKRIQVSVEGLTGKIQQAIAIALMLCLLMPIAAPIPAWAYNVNLSPIGNNEISQTSPALSIEESVLNVFGNVSNGLGSFLSTLLKKEKKFERFSRPVVSEVETTERKVSEPSPSEAGTRIEHLAISPAPPAVTDIPDEERDSLFTGENNLGAPPGQVENGSRVEASALSVRERPGSANFSFGVPIVSLPGRGLDVSIGATYNSRVWNKSTSTYRYNVNEDWLSPGFNLGYGELDLGSGSDTVRRHILTDPDGTRHPMKYRFDSYQSCFQTVDETTDGTFIRLYTYMNFLGDCSITERQVVYPDGTRIKYTHLYSGPYPNQSDVLVPTTITDRNGNQIYISYLPQTYSGIQGISKKIDRITDTLGRQIVFQYDNSPEKKLIAITAPRLAGTSTDQQEIIRFYYQNLTMSTATRFQGTVVQPPSSFPVLQYVYYPGTKSGFRFDYSTLFGMVYKVTRLGGMSVDAQGVLTSQGQEIASTNYNYPLALAQIPPGGLTNVPSYTQRIDDWLGRTTPTAPVHFFSVDETTITGRRITRITDPEGYITESITDTSSGVLKDLVLETSLKNGSGQIFAKNVLDWESVYEFVGFGGYNYPRLRGSEVTDETGSIRKTAYEYGSFKNPIKIREYDFLQTGQQPQELRRTEITYETRTEWINQRLLSLPVQVKTIATEYNGSQWVEKVVSQVDYEYDGGNGGAWLVPRSNIPSHVAMWPYRGNLTKVTAYGNAATLTDAQITRYDHDVAGNVVTAHLTCCVKKDWSFAETTGYAYPVEEKQGANGELITSAVYDRNTGLVTRSVDENSQQTDYEYETDTLRPKKVTFPNGGYVETFYSDKEITDPAQLVPGYVRTKTTLESSKFVENYSYFDARGLGIRAATQTPDGWSVSAIDFDNQGRPVKSYNPFYVPTPTGTIPAATKFSEVVSFDALGRATQVRLQDLTNVFSYPNEAVVTVTFPDGTQKKGIASRAKDQAEKERRQIVDSLGRLIRVDEPTASGLGTAASPNQPTFYSYDGNDNLTKIIQSDGTNTQERRFRYDSLSRLTHEKHIEANPTLDDNGVKGAIDPNKWTKFLKYRMDGLLDYGMDARGVKTEFYEYDGLNRIKEIRFSDGTPTVKYFYDQARPTFFNLGALTRVETAEGDTVLRPNTPATAAEFDYDKMGRVVKHRQTIGAQNYALDYAYNLAGQLISETYPSGKVVSVGYDANGRLSSVTDAQQTYASGFQFQQFGGMLSQINLGNGTAETFGYNDRLQMNLQELKRGSDVLQKYSYGYGQIDTNGDLDPTKNNGQLARIESYIGPSKQWTQKFKYDSVGRLKEAEERRGDNNALSYKQVFDFDRFGNLYRKTSSNPIAGQQNSLLYTPIEENDISKTTNRFTTNTTYDDAGNVTADNKFRSMNFSYDANGRMIKATKIGVPDAFTVFDALGNRVATKINEVWQYMIYDVFGNLVAEYGQAEVGFGGVKFVQQDWQGSVRTVTNSNGYVTSRTDHQAFGGAVGAGVGLRSTAQGYHGTVSTRQGYGLTETDSATGQNHTWFRKQESFAGRWTSPDPYNGSISLGNPQTLNRYSYVENEPTNFVDPSGLLTHPEAPYDPVLYGRDRVGGFIWALLTGQAVLFFRNERTDGGWHWDSWFYSNYVFGNSSLAEPVEANECPRGVTGEECERYKKYQECKAVVDAILAPLRAEIEALYNSTPIGINSEDTQILIAGTVISGIITAYVGANPIPGAIIGAVGTVGGTIAVRQYNRSVNYSQAMFGVRQASNQWYSKCYLGWGRPGRRW